MCIIHAKLHVQCAFYLWYKGLTLPFLNLVFNRNLSVVMLPNLKSQQLHTYMKSKLNYMLTFSFSLLTAEEKKLKAAQEISENFEVCSA